MKDLTTAGYYYADRAVSHHNVSATRPLVEVKTPHFQNGHTPDGKPKASDYEPGVSRLILRAIQDWEVRLFTINAFPDQDLQLKWVRESWDAACTTVGDVYKLPDRILGLIRGRGANARGAFRDEARKLMKEYGFIKDVSARTKAKNILLHNSLIGEDPSEAVFHFKDVQSRRGYGQNRVVVSLIEEEFFSKKLASAGVVYADQFQPFSLPLLGITITTLQICIQEWAEGTFQPMVFSESNVKTLYEHHLAALKDYNSLNPAVVAKKRMKMYEQARKRTGLHVPHATKGLSETTRRQAQEELAGHTGDTSDSEGEADALDGVE
ncbi:hypothetical protein OBBRIDRAFT_835885 [Obba rivulosa]|uniref:DUF6532 domain-containing protein n=1 Tax=Obba rivulosa TaxID=1052685 RepID=A0A8E2B185_9APHY|nr:hypothetical protein OBBRIDRAFT_835885 [Obba rivulosa]